MAITALRTKGCFLADAAASPTMRWFPYVPPTTSTMPTLHGETAGGDRAVTFGARAVSFGDRAVTFEEEPFVIFLETSWEFYEQGAGRRPMLSLTFFPRSTTSWASRKWNFADLVQFRMHKIDGQWHTVRKRTLRRISVLCAPENPHG